LIVGNVSRTAYDVSARGELALVGSAPLPAPRNTVSRSPAAAWQTTYERAKRTWTGVQITYDEFIQHVEGLGHKEAPPFAVDLYLMAACRLGRPLAFHAIEHQHIVRVKAVIQSMVRNTAAVDDVLQDVRKRLVAEPSSRACYAGTGPLGSWIRSVAVNVARDYLRLESARRRREEAHTSLALFGQGEATADDDLLLCIVWQECASACLAAVRDAFQEIQLRERQLLHDYYFRGLSIDALAPLYTVNRATIARRLRRSTEEIRRCVRRRIAALYPREDALTLESMAFTACRVLMADTKSPLYE
jgi:RNA polymerase sigma-70 factor